MKQSSREIVRRCLTFEQPERAPIDVWMLPIFSLEHPEAARRLREEYPSDIVCPPHPCGSGKRENGDIFAAGTYIDEWGCEFVNLLPGVIGEVKHPMVTDPSEWRKVVPPEELIPTGEARREAIRKVNEFCRSTDKFTTVQVCPRLWERYQFLRGSEDAMMDMLLREPGVDELLELIHDFYRRELEFWAETEVDSIRFMDDWGTQLALLIPPPVWRELFKPRYREYCDIGHRAGKFVFMHSDGCIQEIYPDLIEIGVDALNSQLFCMDLDYLSRIARGKITFWGELDRQHTLCDPNPEAGRQAVRDVYEKLGTPDGGVFCNFEAGAGAVPATVFAACEEWMRLTRRG